MGKFECRTYKDKTLCGIACFKEYISQWKVAVRLDTCKQLIINTKKPYRGASIDKMQRQVKEILLSVM